MAPSEALLKRVRQLDEAALTEVYDTYASALYRYAYRLTGHQDTAQDIVAESFHRFLKALYHGGGPKKHLSAWLYRVAHNLVVDHFRRQPREEPVELDAVSIKAPRLSSEEWLVRQERAEKARAALQLLTPLQQQVIALRFLEGMSQAEVAQVIERNVGAVKALQHRALNALRRILEVDDES